MHNVPQSFKEWQEGYGFYADGAPASLCATEEQRRGYKAAQAGAMAAAIAYNAIALGASPESADHILTVWQENGAKL